MPARIEGPSHAAGWQCGSVPTLLRFAAPVPGPAHLGPPRKATVGVADGDALGRIDGAAGYARRIGWRDGQYYG
jgi:hypothetical protein